MTSFLKRTAFVVALTGAAVAMAASASADGFAISFGSGGNGHGRSNAGVTIAFGDVAYGYRDGYWDRGHRWHRWNNDRDYQNYRSRNPSNYRDWNHDRYGGDGWARDHNYAFNDIAFAYRDGYWDKSKRWHRWNDAKHSRDYRNRNAGSYRDWNHDRDGGDGWQGNRGEHRRGGSSHR